MHVFRFVPLLAAACLMLGAGAGPASADSRLFSVETDRPGVTVTGVERNGQALPREGQSGAKTFFRINAGSDTVPCRNQLLFTASNGRQREFIVDLCAHNWEVKLPLATAEAKPSEPRAQATQPAPPREDITRLTISTDNPEIMIEEVHFDRKSLTIDSTDDNAVTVTLPAGQGDTCEHDLGLALSDGRRIARNVDICARDGVVVVALGSEGATPPPPTPEASIPPPPPVAEQEEPPPTPAPVDEPLLVENLVWSSGSEGGRATLSYARPNSDEIELFARCGPGAGDVEITLDRSESGLRPGGSVPVTFTIGDFEKTYNARGSDVSEQSGVSHPELTIGITDPFWPALLRGNDLVIRIGSATAYALSLKGSSAAGKPFLAACDRSDLSAEPSAPPMANTTASDYSCGEEGRLRSQRTDIESRLIFRNMRDEPVRLFWLDYDGRRRPYMTLAPGETGVQPSFFSHPWLVTDSSGRCLGIYYARRDDTEVILGR